MRVGILDQSPVRSGGTPADAIHATLELARAADRWGERPKAFVALKPGQSATAEEIIEFCRRHIAPFKAPAAVAFGELPKTSTGKVQKFLLRDREWKGREKRIN